MPAKSTRYCGLQDKDKKKMWFGTGTPPEFSPLFLKIRFRNATLHLWKTARMFPQNSRTVLSDRFYEFQTQSIAKKSPPNFGYSEIFAYLCVRKITTNEITHKYSLT